MKPTPRALRDRIDAIPGNQPRLNAREQDRHEHIVTAGRTLLAEFGACSFTLSASAQAMRMSAATLRRHLIDLDSLLGHILNRHLLTLSTVMALPTASPEPQQSPSAARF